MAILDGKKVAEELLNDLQKDLKELESKNIHPKLAIVLVGDNPASISYISQKKKACEKLKMGYELMRMDEKIETEELIQLIEKLNRDEKTHGILVQLPLPAHVSTPKVIRAIEPKKDVDGFTAYNLGKTLLGTEFEDLPPCTPKGVIKLLSHYDIDLKGKEVTIVGASNIVGKPLAMMMTNRGATVTLCHILTKDLKFHTVRADIVAVAVGKPNLITEDMVKDGVILIDIGFNRVEGKMRGDCDFEAISKKAGFVSPVPGGAGPMTVACLMGNTIHAAKRLSGLIP